MTARAVELARAALKLGRQVELGRGEEGKLLRKYALRIRPMLEEIDDVVWCRENFGDSWRQYLDSTVFKVE